MELSRAEPPARPAAESGRRVAAEDAAPWGGPAGHGAHGLGAARPTAAGCSQGAAEPSPAAQAGARREES